MDGSRRNGLWLTRWPNWPPRGEVSLRMWNWCFVRDFMITKARGLTSHGQLLTLLGPQDATEGSGANNVAPTPTAPLGNLDGSAEMGVYRSL